MIADTTHLTPKQRTWNINTTTGAGNRPTPERTVNIMIIALVEYINRYGNISMKSFTKETDLEKFITKLESKNVKYLVTKI